MEQEVDGLYRVNFGTPIASGAGVIVLNAGKARGGDSAMYYSGEYVIDGDRFRAHINIDRHTNDNSFQSVFGVDKASIELEGPLSQNSMTLSGCSPQAPGVEFQACINRIA